MDRSPPASSAHGIFQARVLEWFAISFSKGSSWPRYRTRVSCDAGGFFTVWATREAHRGKPIKPIQGFPILYPFIGTLQHIERVKMPRDVVYLKKLMQHYLSSCSQTFFTRIFFYFCTTICSIKQSWGMAEMEIPTGPNAGLANSMISEYSWEET